MATPNPTNTKSYHPMTMVRNVLDWIVETERDLRTAQCEIDYVAVRV